MTAAIVADGPLAPTPLGPRWRGTHVPAALRRHAAPLLNQQFWCWGQDIRGDAGNLLLHYGFSRRRPPWPQRGSSAYTLSLDDGRSLVLWGFGLYYGAGAMGGLFLSRYGCEPRLMADVAPPSTIWAPEQLPPASAPVSADDWRAAFGRLAAVGAWIGAYESWVAEVAGLAYRRRCVAAWDKVRVPPEEMAERWVAVARQCAAWEREIQTR